MSKTDELHTANERYQEIIDEIDQLSLTPQSISRYKKLCDCGRRGIRKAIGRDFDLDPVPAKDESIIRKAIGRDFDLDPDNCLLQRDWFRKLLILLTENPKPTPPFPEYSEYDHTEATEIADTFRWLINTLIWYGEEVLHVHEDLIKPTDFRTSIFARAYKIVEYYPYCRQGTKEWEELPIGTVIEPEDFEDILFLHGQNDQYYDVYYYIPRALDWLTGVFPDNEDFLEKFKRTTDERIRSCETSTKLLPDGTTVKLGPNALHVLDLERSSFPDGKFAFTDDDIVYELGTQTRAKIWDIIRKLLEAPEDGYAHFERSPKTAFTKDGKADGKNAFAQNHIIAWGATPENNWKPGRAAGGDNANKYRLCAVNIKAKPTAS